MFTLMHLNIGLVLVVTLVASVCISAQSIPATTDLFACVESAAKRSNCSSSRYDIEDVATGAIPNCGWPYWDPKAETARPVVRLLHPNINVTNTSVIPLARKLTNLMKYPLTIDVVESAEWTQAPFLEFQNRTEGLRTAWFLDPVLTADMADEPVSALQDLSELVKRDPNLNWNGYGTFFRRFASVYDGKVVGLPVSAAIMLFYYRRDFFAARNLPVPATWEEVVEYAERFNGTDLDGSGRGAWGFCMSRQPDCYNGYTFQSIQVPFKQAMGTSQGFHFDLNTMKPLFNSTGTRRAAELYRRLAPFTAPTEPVRCLPVSLSFVSGNCLMAVGTTLHFKYAMFNERTVVREKTGTAVLPGSMEVEDRETGRLVRCTPVTCPYGRYHTLANGTTVWVNSAPYAGRGAFTYAINRHSRPELQYMAYRLCARRVYADAMWPSVLAPTAETTPVRTEMVDPANLHRYVAANYSANDTLLFMAAVSETVEHSNIALNLRIDGALKYYYAVDRAAVAVMETPEDVGSILARAQAAVEAVYANRSKEWLRQRYYKSIDRKLQDTPQLLSAQAPFMNTRTKIAIGVGAGVGGALLLCGLAVLLWALVGQGRAARGRRRAFVPAASPQCTLVVTDVEGSTNLWEQFPGDVMQAALQLHDSIARKLLAKHNGYESATEGDSFIAAFPDALAALRFSTAFQTELLAADWPTPLLAESDLCRPVYAAPRSAKEAALQLLGRPIPLSSARTLAPIPALFRNSPNSSSFASQASFAAALAGGSPLPDAGSALRNRSGAQLPSSVTQFMQHSAPPLHAPLLKPGVAAGSDLFRTPSEALANETTVTGTDLPRSFSGLKRERSQQLPPPQPKQPPHQPSQYTTAAAGAEQGGTSGSSAPDAGTLVALVVEDSGRPGRPPPSQPLRIPAAEGSIRPATYITVLTPGAGRGPPPMSAPPRSVLSKGSLPSGTSAAVDTGARPNTAGGGGVDGDNPAAGPAFAGPSAISHHQHHHHHHQQHQHRLHLATDSSMLPAAHGTPGTSTQGMAADDGELCSPTALVVAVPHGIQASAAAGSMPAPGRSPLSPDTPRADAPGLVPHHPSGGEDGASGQINAMMSAESDGPTSPGISSTLPVIQAALLAANANGVRLTGGGGVSGGGPALMGSSSSAAGGMAGGGALQGPVGMWTWGKEASAGWQLIDVPAMGAVTAFRGLRVRIGLHSGVRVGELTRNRTSARVTFCGMAIRLAKAVSDTAHGGMVVLSDTAAGLLLGSPERSAAVASDGSEVWHLGRVLLAADLRQVELFQVINPSLGPRLALQPPPRVKAVLLPGVTAAPAGTVALVRMHVGGLGPLRSVGASMAAEVTRVLESLLLESLPAMGGYLSEARNGGAEGILVAFADPLRAVAWALCVQADMLSWDWSPELLAHEFFETIEVDSSAAALCLYSPSFMAGLGPGPSIDDPLLHDPSLSGIRPFSALTTPLGGSPPPGTGAFGLAGPGAVPVSMMVQRSISIAALASRRRLQLQRSAQQPSATASATQVDHAARPTGATPGATSGGGGGQVVAAAACDSSAGGGAGGAGGVLLSLSQLLMMGPSSRRQLVTDLAGFSPSLLSPLQPPQADHECSRHGQGEAPQRYRATLQDFMRRMKMASPGATATITATDGGGGERRAATHGSVGLDAPYRWPRGSSRARMGSGGGGGGSGRVTPRRRPADLGSGTAEAGSSAPLAMLQVEAGTATSNAVQRSPTSAPVPQAAVAAPANILVDNVRLDVGDDTVGKAAVPAPGVPERPCSTPTIAPAAGDAAASAAETPTATAPGAFAVTPTMAAAAAAAALPSGELASAVLPSFKGGMPGRDQSCEDPSLAAGFDSGGPGGCSAEGRHLLFRGPRIKAAVDMGPVSTEICRSTGRLLYRGRLAKQVAKLSEAAQRGQVLCSPAVYAAVGHVAAACGITSTPIRIAALNRRGPNLGSAALGSSANRAPTLGQRATGINRGSLSVGLGSNWGSEEPPTPSAAATAAAKANCYLCSLASLTQAQKDAAVSVSAVTYRGELRMKQVEE